MESKGGGGGVGGKRNKGDKEEGGRGEREAGVVERCKSLLHTHPSCGILVPSGTEQSAFLGRASVHCAETSPVRGPCAAA